MGDNVSFKVFLKNNDEQEVRRFVIDKNVSTSFDYLVGKLRVIFPQIQRSEFTVGWTDDDGDHVTITTDEELIIALTEMAGPLYRLTVTVKKASRAQEEKEKEKEKKEDSAAATKAATPSDDEEDWTVVTDKKEAGAAGLYPSLTENPPVDVPSAPVASHPDPKIQVALQAMMNMGFSNEGGWLSSLLEAKNGDIGKVLDILQPVKK